jgi:o-succinylbenzoate synthase
MSAEPRIVAFDVRPMNVSLEDEFVISRGRIDEVENAWVSISLEDGSTGFGEIAPFAALTGETRDRSVRVATQLCEALLGQAADAPRLAGEMAQLEPAQPAARTGVECALVDALAKSCGVPLHQMWGGADVRTVETDITLPILEEARVDELARRWFALGFRVFKLKVGADAHADAGRVHRLAEAFPEAGFVLDANQAFSPEAAVRFIDALGPFRERVHLYEQPVDRADLEGMRQVGNLTGVPVAADESVFTLDDARRVIEQGAADVINLKIMKTGLHETLSIAALARERGVGLMMGGMVETRLAMGFSLALALGCGGVTHFDLDTPLLMQSDPIVGGYTYDGPRITPSPSPGTGAVPAEAGGR